MLENRKKIAYRTATDWNQNQLKSFDLKRTVKKVVGCSEVEPGRKVEEV